MLKSFAVALLFLMTGMPVFAQQEQPAQPFPFHVTLTRTDSTQTDSKNVLSTGKPTVLAFWLTTCVPCIAEFGAYSQNYAQWKEQADFNMVGISIDFPERFKKIGPMAAEKKWPFPVYWDSARAFKTLLPGGLNGLPQVFLFDKNGTLVWQHKGFYQGMEKELFAQIKALL